VHCLLRGCHSYHEKMRTLALFLAALPLACADETIRVEGGLLAGRAGNSAEIRVYKGIPYAKPPLGELRWRAPEAPAKWDGVRAAGGYSATCMQQPYPEGSPFRTAAEPVSEDCLYLNVWSGAKSAAERRPVMVWVHGGALTRGAGSLTVYDGEALAAKGVVVVTINYRLGLLGFLAHPELTREAGHHASGNYGILDQIAALQWVQRNIAAFGGDPRRVTIFGESAGSWSVNTLVASPMARGLFQRAIGESGAFFAPLPALADAEKSGERIATQLGAASLAELRARPAADLAKLAADQARPNVDGWLLPDQVMALFSQGKQNDVPILIGSNADEGTAFTPPALKAEGFKALAAMRFGAAADQYLKIYPAGSDQEAHASAAAAIRDQTFGWEMRTWARMQTKTGKAKAFVYFFSRVPPGPAGAALGAYHASEIRYVFRNLQTTQEVDRKLADAMSSYWVNFAATGDPNGMDLPPWPSYSPGTELAMGLGERIAVIELPHKAALDFLDTAMSKH
jgi:para-nitrobenzyl esterase